MQQPGETTSESTTQSVPSTQATQTTLSTQDVPPTRPCAHCGRPVPQRPSSGRPFRYCQDNDEACVRAARAARQRERNAPGLPGQLARTWEVVDRLELLTTTLADSLSTELSATGVESRVAEIRAEAAAQIAAAHAARDAAQAEAADARQAQEIQHERAALLEQDAQRRITEADQRADAANQAAAAANERASDAVKEREAAREEAGQARIARDAALRDADQARGEASAARTAQEAMERKADKAIADALKQAMEAEAAHDSIRTQLHVTLEERTDLHHKLDAASTRYEALKAGSEQQITAAHADAAQATEMLRLAELARAAAQRDANERTQRVAALEHERDTIRAELGDELTRARRQIDELTSRLLGLTAELMQKKTETKTGTKTETSAQTRTAGESAS